MGGVGLSGTIWRRGEGLFSSSGGRPRGPGVAWWGTEGVRHGANRRELGGTSFGLFSEVGFERRNGALWALFGPADVGDCPVSAKLRSRGQAVAMTCRIAETFGAKRKGTSGAWLRRRTLASRHGTTIWYWFLNRPGVLLTEFWRFFGACSSHVCLSWQIRTLGHTDAWTAARLMPTPQGATRWPGAGGPRRLLAWMEAQRERAEARTVGCGARPNSLLGGCAGG